MAEHTSPAGSVFAGAGEDTHRAEVAPAARHIDAYINGDGTGFFLDCPRCHFYKNATSEPGEPCRSTLCDGIVERVAFQVISPVRDVTSDG
jgi:hypothetical protein